MNRFTLNAALSLLLLAPCAMGDTYAWKNVAIKGGGFVSGILTHPNAPGVMYARTDIGGAYRWNSVNNSWIPLLDFAADANPYGIESLAVDPSDSNRLYIAASRNSPNGTSLKYIFVSTNQGATFSFSYTPPFTLDGNYDGRGNGERLGVDPNLGSTLFYGTRNARVYKSVNSGSTWSQVSSFPVTTTANGIGFVFVQFIQSSGTPGTATPTIYVAVSRTGTNLFRSLDGGGTWSGIWTGVGSTNMYPHHAAQDGAGNMFITFSDNQGPNNIADGRVVKLNLSTLVPTDVTPIKHSGEQGGYGGVSVDRQNTNIVVLSTIDRWWSPAPYAPWDQIYRSTNSGATWVETMPATLPGSTSAPWSVARSPHWADDVEIDPFNSNRVFFVTGYGIIGTTNMTVADSNGSVKWVFNSDGLEETVPLGLASPPSGPNLLSAHGDIGAFRHFNVDVSPPLADYFSSHRGTSYGIDFAQSNPNFIARLFSGTPYGCYSTDGGSSWFDFAAAPPTIGNGVGNLAVSADGTRIVWMPQSSVAYYSANNGATWTASTGGPTATRVPVADRVNGNKFYIYNGTQMYVSTNGGATYGLGGTTTSSGGGPPCAVFGNEGHVLLPLGNGLWRSTNSGTNFTQFSTVQSASYVSVGKAAAGQSYPAIFILGQIGGVSGIYRSDDQGTNWVRINDNQHQFGLSWVHSFCADPRVYGRVYFGTEGRGVIYGDLLPANTPPTFLPIADQTVNVGQTVAFTSSATDNDTPVQTLTFSLLSGPAGALLDTNTGAFSWRPPVTVADSTNPVSLQVADNGTPSMSATQSFKVIVNPLTLPTLGSFSLSAGQFSFQVNGDTGPDYEIQSSTNLVDWVPAFTTNSPAMPFNWTDPSAGASPSLFYRIVVGPPLP